MHKPDLTAQLYRTHLTRQEIENPHYVVVKMFDLSALEYLRLELWEVLKAALSPKAFNFMGTPATVIRLSNDLNRLVDALWLRMKYKQVETVENKAAGFPSEPHKPNDAEYRFYLYPILNTFKGRIKRLSKAETEDPHLALERIFNHHNPKEWKKLLAVWSEYALKPYSMIFNGNESEFILDYEYLEKLLEVAHIFNMETEHYDQDHPCQNDQLAFEIDDELTKEALTFAKYYPAARANRNIRSMLLDYLQSRNGEVPFSLEAFLGDLNWLMTFLDQIEDKKKRNE